MRSFGNDIKKIMIALKNWDTVHFLHFKQEETEKNKLYFKFQNGSSKTCLTLTLINSEDFPKSLEVFPQFLQ